MCYYSQYSHKNKNFSNSSLCLVCNKIIFPSVNNFLFTKVTLAPTHSLVLFPPDQFIPEQEVSPVDGVEDEEEEGGEEEEEPVHLVVLIIPSGVFLFSPLLCPDQTVLSALTVCQLILIK